ncbi:MAG TPA: hypothetical protein DHV62_02145, partial [Elusimicrobia bacterium]|nr:hypothetical protein [Elusimicrobiota bacterium]
MKLPTFRILFIEDNPADVRFIKEMLKEVRDNIFEIESVEYFSAGLKRLSEGGIDIVLLDLGLPDSQGFDTFHKLSTQFPELPVIVVTGLDDEATGIRAVKEGAQDYLIKWEMKEHLLTSDIRYAIERKHTEKMLRESEEKYRLLVETSDDFVFAIDLEGKFMYGNKKSIDRFGNLYGKSYTIPVSPKYHQLVKENFIRRLRGEKIEPYPIEVIDKKGNRLWVEISGSPLVKEGKIVGAVYFEKDITERKQAEKDLKESKEYAEHIVSVTPSAIFTVDTNRLITSWNKRAVEITGYTPEETLGKECLLFAEQPCKEKCGLYSEEVKKPIFNKECTLRRKDGQLRIISKNVDLLYNSTGQRIGGIESFEDITEHRRLEDQFLQAQKMEAIGRFSGGIAHDFNNMLTAIIGYSQLLLAALPENDPSRADLEEIKKAADHAAALTRKLLAFSRKQVLQPQIVNLNTLVSDIEKMLHRIIGEDIELVTILEPRLSAIQVDPGQVEQVLMNLVVNARDAMPNGGTLTLKTENVTIDEEYVNANPEARVGKFVSLSVQDTGSGMDKETLQHIFEPFFTTKETGKGTGLGLSTVYGIVKQHNGWVNVYSEPGQGTVFKIYLPVFGIAGEKESKEEVVTSAELKGKGERILLVEDEEGVRKFSERVLKKNGYT